MKKSLDEKIFLAIDTVIVAFLSALCLIPLLYSLATSLSSGAAVDAGKVFLWPVDVTLAAYRMLLNTNKIFGYFGNSVLLTLVGTVLSLASTILCAYPLSRSYLWQRNKVAFYFTFTMLFGGGMIPTFMLVRNLNLINSYWSIWLTGLISPYNMMIMRSFFQGIPEELSESARVDGCGEFRLLAQIYLPLSKPVLATEALLYGVGYWNMYQKVMLYMQDTTKYTLPVYIQQMVFNLQQLNMDTVEAAHAGASQIVSESLKSASVIVLIVPMLCVYPFLQKYFVKGVTLGAVKG